MIRKTIVALNEEEKRAVSTVAHSDCSNISCKDCPYSLEDINQCFKVLAGIIEERLSNERQ